MKRACIVNVGVNASHHPLRSPIFDDHRFEFVPIPEAGRRVSAPDCPLLPTYALMRSCTGTPFTTFIPKSYHSCKVHNDPEFDSYTYGDYPTYSPRASNLRKLSEDDYIVFFARLEAFHRDFLGRAGFYFIGYFEIEAICRNLTVAPTIKVLQSIKSNAHVKRALWNQEYWNDFWVFKGSENSSRLNKAVPLTLKTLKHLGLLPNHRPSDDRTKNQLFGSYLRATRLVEGLRANELLNYLHDS